MKQKPDEQLAMEIVAEIGKAKLLPADKLGEVSSKLAAGQLTIEDWTLLAELAEDKAPGGSHGDSH
jgi:hypothetical protein